MAEELLLLIVEDSEDDAELLVRELSRSGYQVTHRRVQTRDDLTFALADNRWDLVIADYTMPDFSGVEALSVVRHHNTDVPFIFVSGTLGEDTAIAALKAGAQDYIVKGNTKRLVPAIERELREAQARQERKRLESERRAVEERYRQVLTIAGDGIIVVDANLIVSIFNRGAERMFGYPAAIVVGQPLDLLWPSSATARSRERVLEALASRDPQAVELGEEFTGLRSDGTEFPVEATLSAVGEGDEVTLTIILRDVSERRRAERKLRQLSRAVEQSANLVVIADANGLIEYVNPRFLAATGFAPEEIVGRRPFFWSRVGEGAALNEEIWSTVLAGRNWRGEFDNECRDGASLTVSATISPVTDEAGEIGHVIAIEEDITRRKEMELQLQQAQKMEAIGLLTGGVAHDFNNLLAIVIGNLDLLSSQLEEDSDSQTSIQLALAASLRGADLTRQLLAFARQQPLSPRVFDLNQLVDETVTMLRRIIGEKVEVRTQLHRDLWSTEADTTQVETTLANLAINARDAMPDGGELRVTTTNAHLGADDVAQLAGGLAAGDYVLLSVADTGQGMPAELIERVCEPFFSTKPAGKGTGLGLSMAYGFAKQSGGHLRIESEIGSGTRVTVYLPRAREKEDTVVASGDPEPVRIPEVATILVVEDNPDVRDIVVRQLTDLGFAVVAVDSAGAARAILQGERAIDLLFSDIVLPGGTSGQELAREARHLRPGIRILLTSGYSAGPVNGDLVEDGVEFIGKPYRRVELARKVNAVLGASGRG